MIIDHIQNADRYAALHPAFAKAFAFLRQAGLEQFKEGRREIDGDRLYAIAVVGEGRSKAEALLEGHRRYIDVQFLVSGADCMGWRSAHACSKVNKPYDDKGDAILWSDKSALWVDVPAGHFAIFWPHDAHAPMFGQGRMHKAIVKVAVE